MRHVYRLLIVLFLAALFLLGLTVSLRPLEAAAPAMPPDPATHVTSIERGGPAVAHLGAASANLAEGVWFSETVESHGDVGQRTSIAIDGSGRPHISYIYAYNPRVDDAGDLRHAWLDGTTWQVETVDGSGEAGWSTSLALSGLGRPRIAYHNPKRELCNYAWFDGTDWHLETADDTHGSGMYASLELDGSGNPHISHFNYDLRALMYAKRSGTTWVTATVDSSETTAGPGCSLALDQSGRPRISYLGQVGYQGKLKYAWRKSSGWKTEAVISVGDTGYDSSLALDAQDRPHISYFGLVYRGLKHAWKDDGQWYSETVDSTKGAGTDTSLVLDALDRPRISYRNGDELALMFAWHDGTAWHTQTVDSGGEFEYTSLALDDEGWPHISYYDETNEDLRHAWMGPPAPALSLSKQASPGDGLGGGDSLTYTLLLSGSGLSVELWDPLPNAVAYVTGSVNGTLVPPAAYSSAAHAIVWQGTLPADANGVLHFLVTVGASGTHPLSPVAPIVNTAWMTDARLKRQVFASAVVNARRFYLPFVLVNP